VCVCACACQAHEGKNLAAGMWRLSGAEGITRNSLNLPETEGDTFAVWENGNLVRNIVSFEKSISEVRIRATKGACQLHLKGAKRRHSFTVKFCNR